MEDPGQCISLLNAHRQDDLDDDDDDASIYHGEAMAETVFESPPLVATGSAPGGDGGSQGRTPPTAVRSRPQSGSNSAGVKDPLQQQSNAMKLPLDQTDYLQPRSSVPATYLDLLASPGNQHLCAPVMLAVSL